ncbi:hypothetical protein KEM55_004543 [Ascosphaera atra]|nr:hypothetical protein KEM55_004543 [Ascosphaera atra]
MSTANLQAVTKFPVTKQLPKSVPVRLLTPDEIVYLDVPLLDEWKREIIRKTWTSDMAKATEAAVAWTVDNLPERWEIAVITPEMMKAFEESKKFERVLKIAAKMDKQMAEMDALLKGCEGATGKRRKTG